MRAAKMAEFAIKNDFTQLLGPTHFLQNHTDPWLTHNTRMMEKTRQFLDQESSDIELIYPLSLPIDVLHTPAYRRTVIAALKDAPFDALWLKVDNFGGDASGDKTIAYIEACRDFHALGVPIVSDHVGGLPALGLIAFSAVGGICHGVTLVERFNSYSWRKAQLGNSGRTPQVRVYIERLEAHLKPAEAKALLNSSSRVKGRFGCTDTHCCNGVQGQLARPAQHYIHQRSREVTELSNTLRASEFKATSTTRSERCQTTLLPSQVLAASQMNLKRNSQRRTSLSEPSARPWPIWLKLIDWSRQDKYLSVGKPGVKQKSNNRPERRDCQK